MNASAEDVLQIIRDHQLVAGPTAVGPDAPLFTGRLVDSFGAVALIAALEGRFGIRIDVSRLTPETFDTPEQIARFVSES